MSRGQTRKGRLEELDGCRLRLSKVIGFEPSSEILPREAPFPQWMIIQPSPLRVVCSLKESRQAQQTNPITSKPDQNVTDRWRASFTRTAWRLAGKRKVSYQGADGAGGLDGARGSRTKQRKAREAAPATDSGPGLREEDAKAVEK
jgi:hypothetical protein